MIEKRRVTIFLDPSGFAKDLFTFHGISSEIRVEKGNNATILKILQTAGKGKILELERALSEYYSDESVITYGLTVDMGVNSDYDPSIKEHNEYMVELQLMSEQV